MEPPPTLGNALPFLRSSRRAHLSYINSASGFAPPILVSSARNHWRLIRGGLCESATEHESILCLSDAFRCSSAEPRKVPKVRYGPAAGGHAPRLAPTHDEQPLARRNHGCGHAPGDDGVDDDDDAVKAPPSTLGRLFLPPRPA